MMTKKRDEQPVEQGTLVAEPENPIEWEMKDRPGYFGKRRDTIIADLNKFYGKDNWKLQWVIFGKVYTFEEACRAFYEGSYYQYFLNNPKELDRVCSFGECIDNAMTNIQSGLDYTKQESTSTHIQDIAVRNVLSRLGRKFEGDPGNILVIRSKDSTGFRYGPGNVPFLYPKEIIQPTLVPHWAQAGSVEDFWQSNKYIVVKK